MFSNPNKTVYYHSSSSDKYLSFLVLTTCCPENHSSPFSVL